MQQIRLKAALPVLFAGTGLRCVAEADVREMPVTLRTGKVSVLNALRRLTAVMARRVPDVRFARSGRWAVIHRDRAMPLPVPPGRRSKWEARASP
jgi:hypothetical protein